MFEDESSLQSLSSEQLKSNKKSVVHSLFEDVVRDLGSPKVEDELNKNVGQWNQTKPEEEKDSLIKKSMKEAQKYQTWNLSTT